MKILSITFMLLSLLGCNTINLESFSTFEINQHSNEFAKTDEVIDYHGLALRSGQILVSDTNTALNFFVTLTDTTYHPYAHAGIISIEHGKPYLYHAVAKLNLLFKGSLTDKTKGTVKRTPLNKYLKDKTVVAIYSFPSTDLEKSMAEFAIRSYKEKLPYDALFDETDGSKVYCSEFIVEAVNSGNGPPIVLRSRSRNPSIDQVYEGLGIPSKNHYFVRDLIANTSRVALFSRTLNSEQVALYFALREELYRRFTPDQKIGNLMRWTGFGVVFRESVKSFIERGTQQNFRKRLDNETRQEWVTALADEVLGPMKVPKP